MIGWLLVAAAAATAPAGPGMRLGPPRADGLPDILILDHAGRVAARASCISNEYVNPDDAAAKLMTSPEVAAIILARDGHLTMAEELGPAKFDCVVLSADHSPTDK